MHWKGLWALFGYHGEVVDAFIPTKRCRNGKRFGFVRFSNERDAQRVIMRLNGFFLLGKRIRLKMARYNGRRKQIEWSYLKDFFIKIEPWSEKLKINERVAWIEVSGVPLHCWKYETFKRVAGLWGKLVSVGENLTKVHNFKKIGLLISITQSNVVDDLVSMTVGDDLFLVRLDNRKEIGVQCS
ncbi:hypothetical protein ES319_A05G294400v1 [Gossypium barbadense]|uniref:RRM domain-containing protein n=1 Tax=Gossypium barbadense TaxID=3634 RepID=A0A5J5VVW9_GOSBA|nr:hypothetical protein ES319_A05G294400v1 [Gossypium barbadense]